MRDRAGAHDATATIPSDDLDALRDAGALCPPAGSVPALLTLLGRGNMALGRLMEAHVNAIRLIDRYGTAEQRHSGHRDAGAGRLFGLWVTDAPDAPLTRTDSILHGSKSPCSGVGAVSRVLTTVETPRGSVMAVLPADRLGSEPLAPAAGMRAGGQGRVRFDGAPCLDEDLVGTAGDYLREPELSCGAWRTSAVTAGGLDSLIDALRRHLLARGHDGAPLQQERFGLALIAQGTARQWVQHAARCADDAAMPVAARVAEVNLARIAVEAACLDAMRHVQRSAGLAALLPGPLERIARDLATYLRQPAPDMVLTEAAAYRLAQPGP